MEMEYDAKKNFIQFILNKNIMANIQRALTRKYNKTKGAPFIDENNLLGYFLSKTIYPDDYIDRLGSWSTSEEGHEFWSNLHNEWRCIYSEKTTLINKNYNSIW